MSPLCQYPIQTIKNNQNIIKYTFGLKKLKVFLIVFIQDSKNLVILTSLLLALANLKTYSSFFIVEKIGNIKLKYDKPPSSLSSLELTASSFY